MKLGQAEFIDMRLLKRDFGFSVVVKGVRKGSNCIFSCMVETWTKICLQNVNLSAKITIVQYKER